MHEPDRRCCRDPRDRLWVVDEISDRAALGKIIQLAGGDTIVDSENALHHCEGGWVRCRQVEKSKLALYLAERKEKLADLAVSSLGVKKVGQDSRAEGAQTTEPQGTEAGQQVLQEDFEGPAVLEDNPTALFAAIAPRMFAAFRMDPYPAQHGDDGTEAGQQVLQEADRVAEDGKEAQAEEADRETEAYDFAQEDEEEEEAWISF